jgi:hydroxyethylthiazole kinase-like uncharacterized protein yjeF
MTLPVDLFSASQLRQLEADAISAGTPGYTLMCRAGAAAHACLRQHWPHVQQIVVVVGSGNNGGDGMVLARLAMQDKLSVTVLLTGDATALRGEAAQAHADLIAAGGAVRNFDPALLAAADVVVDALLGIGVRAPLRDDWLAAIEAMNHCGKPVFALDLPSGLDPDSGCALPAVRAVATMTFIALKQGLFLGEGPDHAGKLYFDALETAAAQRPVTRLLTKQMLPNVLKPRERQSHKAQYGRVVVIGGGAGMPGAVRLAAEAALLVGAGLVTAASLPDHLGVIAARPELMFHALRDASDVQAAIGDADVILIGPGLGRGDWALRVLDATFNLRQPAQHLIVDADALNLVAAGHGLQRCNDWILTPHPGEAARLLAATTQEIQQDRMASLGALCEQRAGTIVLKGAATLVGHAGEIPRMCVRGNPGMAVPGMGDVLAGAIAGILAQCGDPFESAAAAVQVHATAGDRCARNGIRGVLALDVAHEMRSVLAPLP